MAEITRILTANICRQFFFVITTTASTCCFFQNFQLKADFLSSQKPLAASWQVLTCSQNNFLSLHEYDNLMKIDLVGISETAKSSYYDHFTTY